MTPQERARDLLLRLAAIRPEGPDDISNLLVMSFEDAISAERALNADLVEALEGFMLNEEFMIEDGIIPDVRNDIIWANARSAIARAKEEA